MEMLHVRLKSELHKELKASCALQGITITSLIKTLVEEYLSDYKKEAA